jgi:DNA invertase Pin-like site-specific DNA recombinase
MISAAIYARVSSARQKKDETIGSQTAALREHAAGNGLEVPEEWVFEDEGHSGATLVRPALEALRDLAAQGCLDVVLVYSPDRLARKFAYQALLLEEFARAGVRVEFIKNGARGDSPEDQLLVQFQGMFAEYEKPSWPSGTGAARRTAPAPGPRFAGNPGRSPVCIRTAPSWVMCCGRLTFCATRRPVQFSSHI